MKSTEEYHAKMAGIVSDLAEYNGVPIDHVIEVLVGNVIGDEDMYHIKELLRASGKL